MLVAHLPPDSHTARAITGDPEIPWTRLEFLMAGVFDALQVLAWQNANQGRRHPTPRPKPLERPGVGGRTHIDSEEAAERAPIGAELHYGRPQPLSAVKALLASSRPGADSEEHG